MAVADEDGAGGAGGTAAADGGPVGRDTRRAVRAPLVLDRLAAAMPDARIALDFTSTWELLVATTLSAQSTDERVNRVTPQLFARFPDAAATASATQ